MGCVYVYYVCLDYRGWRETGEVNLRQAEMRRWAAQLGVATSERYVVEVTTDSTMYAHAITIPGVSTASLA